MALNQPRPSQLQQPTASYATHCSLRGNTGVTSLHPLKQNPPSIASIVEEETCFDDVDIRDAIQPPPSALTTATAYDPHNSHLPLEGYSSTLRIDHQRSLTDTFFTNCQPLINRATSTFQQHTSKAPFHSPSKSLASFISSRSTIESTASQPKIRAGAKALSNWFNGSSAPVNLGLAAPDKAQPDDEYDSEEEAEEGNMISNIFNRGPSFTRSTGPAATDKQSAETDKQSTLKPQASPASKFGWLLPTQKNPAVPNPAPTPTYHNPSDELLNLNISQSLFPYGAVDSLDPSSFQDLLSNAESLLSRFQTSYRALSSALSDARAEQGAQKDELEEADTRIRHVKMQLEAMAARASEQDLQMRKLMEELSFERRARQEEEQARKRSLAMIRGPGCAHTGCQQAELATQFPRRRTRASKSDVSVDSGFESECDSEAASVFSKRSGALSPTDTEISEVDSQETTSKDKRPLPTQRRSTYDKVLRGSVDLQKGGWGCANCEGGAQAAVWGRLAKEREENSTLRRRVEALEDAVDGALNVVDGPWGM